MGVELDEETLHFGIVVGGETGEGDLVAAGRGVGLFGLAEEGVDTPETDGATGASRLAETTVMHAAPHDLEGDAVVDDLG
jgi:hypothetical protein